MHGSNGGVADSLDEAKAAFRAAWEAHGVGGAWRGSALGGSGPEMLALSISGPDPNPTFRPN